MMLCSLNLTCSLLCMNENDDENSLFVELVHGGKCRRCMTQRCFVLVRKLGNVLTPSVQHMMA